MASWCARSACTSTRRAHEARTIDTRHISRRAALAAVGVLAILALGGAASAQRLPLLGYVANDNADAERLAAFKKGLADLGYVEDRNIAIEYRYAKLDAEYAAVIADLLARKVDIVLAANAPAASAAAKATRTVPVVLLAVNDPVGLGVADNLERPGRNVTGTTIYAPHLIAERVRILKRSVPGLAHAGAFCNGGNPNNAAQLALVRAACSDLGIALDTLDIRSPEDVQRAFDDSVASGARGFFNCVDSFVNSQRFALARLMARARLPMIYTDREYVLAGGLMALGVGHLEGHYGAAKYVDAILKGANPAGMPITPPSQVELSASRSALQALDIELPQQIAERVTEWLP